jgi:hypothetical protein
LPTWNGSTSKLHNPFSNKKIPSCLLLAQS